MPTLETLLSAADKARLTEALPKRFSCRHYGAPLTLPEWSALSFAAGRYRMPHARLILLRVDEALFTPSMSGDGQITGCTAVAAVVVEQSALRCRVHAGILGEAFCLEAAAMDLSTCWVTDSYRERMLALPIKPYETLLAVIAVGHAAAAAPGSPYRKSMAQYCRGDVSAWPAPLRHAAENVGRAPSRRNLQPWQISCERGRFIIHLSDFQSIETGIAALHAELALTAPHTWHFARGTWEDAAWVDLP